MNTRTSYVLIAIITAVLTISTSTAFAQGTFKQLPCPNCVSSDPNMIREQSQQIGTPIRVWTDKDVYDHQSTIMVEGTVSALRQGADVALVVTGPPPFNNIITIDQIPVGSDGRYQTTLNTAGTPWKYDGTYTITVTYGNQQINNRAFVVLTGGVMVDAGCESDELPATGQCIPYSISGSTVTNAWFSSQTNSLTLSISGDDDGTLMINPSTEAIRGIFMVLVNGEEWDDVEIDGNQVTVNFPAGTEEIEIIGTFAIPEFGAIAALILAVAIISIIAVSARTRLNVLPKY